ncbi:MAG: HD domain-containing protein [Bacteroidota bacterium]
MRQEAAIEAILARLRDDLPRNLFYHSVDHTLDVLDRVESLGRSEGVGESDLVLLRVAACYHDAGFLINNRDHERLGCKIVRTELPKYDFSPLHIETICGMIRATKVPQSPRNHLQEIICDAELDYLGRPDFYVIGERLYRELKAFRILDSVESWNQLQIKFLRGHRYWTKTNIRERKPGKDAHLAELVKRWEVLP